MLKEPFKVLEGQVLTPNTKCGIFRAITKQGNTITITHSPTQNCQIYSIGNACNILGISDVSDEDVISTLKECQKVSLKMMVLLDLKGTAVARLERIWPKESIVWRQDYTNTTYNTHMSMFLCKTIWLSELIKIDKAKEAEAKLSENKEKPEVELPF